MYIFILAFVALLSTKSLATLETLGDGLPPLVTCNRFQTVLDTIRFSSSEIVQTVFDNGNTKVFFITNPGDLSIGRIHDLWRKYSNDEVRGSVRLAQNNPNITDEGLVKYFDSFEGSLSNQYKYRNQAVAIQDENGQFMAFAAARISTSRPTAIEVNTLFLPKQATESKIAARILMDGLAYLAQKPLVYISILGYPLEGQKLELLPVLQELGFKHANFGDGDRYINFTNMEYTPHNKTAVD